MASSRTVMILNTAKEAGNAKVAAALTRLFGASSIEECLEVYARLGAAEKSGIDHAISRVMTNGEPGFIADTRDEVWRLSDDASGTHSADLQAPDVSQERGSSWVDTDPERSRFAEMDAVSFASFEHNSFRGGASETFRVRRQLVSLGRSYSVEDAAGERRFRVVGHVRFARTFDIGDAGGNVLYTVREKLLASAPTFVVSRDAAEIATLERTTTARAANDTFDVTFSSGASWSASGVLWRDEGVQITRDGACVTMIRREQLLLREVFCIQAAAGTDLALMIALAMAIVETDSTRGND